MKMYNYLFMLIGFGIGCAALGMSQDDLNQQLYDAVMAKNLDRVKLLVEIGADVNVNKLDFTPLMSSALYGNKDISEFLLKHGAKVNARRTFINGATPLMLGLTRDIPINRDTIKLFLRYGADINARDNHNRTPLTALLVLKGPEELVKFLIENGADVNAVDTYKYRSMNGRTILQVAEEHACEKIISIIKEVIVYQEAVAKDKIYAKQTALANAINAEKTNFTKEEWLNIALSNNNVKEINYCIKQGIFKPIDVLNALLEHPNFPYDTFKNKWEKASDDDKKELKKLAQEEKNTTFLDAILKYDLDTHKENVYINIFYNKD